MSRRRDVAMMGLARGAVALGIALMGLAPAQAHHDLTSPTTIIVVSPLAEADLVSPQGQAMVTTALSVADLEGPMGQAIVLSPLAGADVESPMGQALVLSPLADAELTS